MTHQTTKDAKQYRKRQLSRIRYTSILNYNKEDKKKRYLFYSFKYNNKHYYDCFAKNNIKTTII
jgi:hypothetical protein